MRITDEQVAQLRDQTRVVAYTKYLARMASLNTALIPKGQQFAKQMEALAKIVDASKQEYIATIFDAMNIKQADVNLETGELKNIQMKV